VRFRARVSTGTYIRSIAHDLGIKLGCGAHLDSLRRTAVGQFQESQATTLEKLADAVARGEQALIDISALLPEFAIVRVDSVEAKRARAGNTIFVDAPTDRVKIVDETGSLIALGARKPDGSLHPDIVFA
jgi:tRNA pseudouridine55 synthase